jgi:hypothetical protein
LPRAAVVLDPTRRVLELCGPQAALASPPDLLGDDELRILQHPHVLLDAVERQAERLRQLTERGRMRGEELEDPASGRIREGEERPIECCV